MEITIEKVPKSPTWIKVKILLKCLNLIFSVLKYQNKPSGNTTVYKLKNQEPEEYLLFLKMDL